MVKLRLPLIKIKDSKLLIEKLINLIQPTSGDKVLEIGTGSGYQTAILSYLGLKLFVAV